MNFNDTPTWEETLDNAGKAIIKGKFYIQPKERGAIPLKSFISSLLQSERAKIMGNIGMLRQWLNEKPADRLVTNEDIETWLFDDVVKMLKT